MTHRRIPIWLPLVFALSACSSLSTPSASPTTPLRQIRLPMGYIPNVQFAPFYVAVERGYFQEEGIELEFDYSWETDAVTLVGADELQFAIVSGEQVPLARAQGLPIVYVMAWWQKYPVGVAAPEGSSILQPADLVGRRVGIPCLCGASYVGYQALLSAAGVPPEDVTLDVIGYTQVEALLAGQEDAVVIYANNEPVQLAAQGMPVSVMRVADFVSLASNGMITNETTIAQRPDLVRAMVRASLRGLADTLADPDAAFEICKKYVEGLAEADQTIQRRVLDQSLEFWRADHLGVSEPAAWENMQRVLLEMGSMTQSINISEAFTNQFVP